MKNLFLPLIFVGVLQAHPITIFNQTKGTAVIFGKSAATDLRSQIIQPTMQFMLGTKSGVKEQFKLLGGKAGSIEISNDAASNCTLTIESSFNIVLDGQGVVMPGSRLKLETALPCAGCQTKKCPHWEINFSLNRS